MSALLSLRILIATPHPSRPINRRPRVRGSFAEVDNSDSEDVQSNPPKRQSLSGSNTTPESAPPSDSSSGASGDDEQSANVDGDRNEDSDESDVEFSFSLDSIRDSARQICRTTVLFADFTHILLAGQTRYDLELEGEDDTDNLDKIM